MELFCRRVLPPFLESKLLAALKAQLAGGVAVAIPDIRGLFTAIMRACNFGDLLDSEVFKMSDTWIRTFLAKHGLSSRRATNCSQHLPEDSAERMRDFVDRLACVIFDQNIPKGQVINADQTGLCLVPASKRTWAAVGSK